MQLSAEHDRKRIAELREQLHHHNHLYYVEARSEISDREFDVLLDELAELESRYPDLHDANSPTRRVGGAPVDEFATLPHSRPMLSLGKTYSAEELKEFDARLRRFLEKDSPNSTTPKGPTEEGPDEPIAYVGELKIDGVGIALRYENGALVRALTRGDGTQGDDITENARTVRGIPLRLQANAPAQIEVRGEVYIRRSEFEDWNHRRAKAGLPRMMNPRNSAAGSLKLLDSKEVAARPLRAWIYTLVDPEAHGFAKHSETLDYMAKLGFPVEPNGAALANITDAIEHCQKWDNERHNLDYETDGMVLKVDSHDQQNALGFTSKAPRWGIAYKFETSSAVTQVEEISVQIGRTGNVTPVAHLTPVELLGTIVKRATLHNKDEIARLGVRVGDWVEIEKGGEIIPKVIAVLTDRRDGSESPFVFPTECPSCATTLHESDEEVAVRCTNPLCPEQRKGRIEHFVGRGALDIEGIGETLVHQLVEANLVHTVADLYALTVPQLAALERMGEKSAQKVVTGLENARTPELHRFLFGLGIRHVGATAGRLLAEHFGSLEAVQTASSEALEAVHGIGDEIALSVIGTFASPAMVELLEKFQELGVWPKTVKVSSSAEEGAWSGKSFVITGTLNQWSREEAAIAIREHGGKTASSVSKKTDYLIAGEKAGSKRTKAESLGVRIVEEEEFRAALEDPSRIS